MTESTSSSDTAGAPALHRAIGPKLLLFLVIGDMLGTGIYALTGDVAGVVGGAGWLSFGAAFIVAMFSATSYLELVGKYPRAAGAALLLARGVSQQRAHVLRRLRGDVLGAHVRRRGEPHVRGLFRGVHDRARVGRGVRVHLGSHGDQLPRRRGVREVQRRAHLHRVQRAPDRDRGGLHCARQRRRRRGQGARVQCRVATRSRS